MVRGLHFLGGSKGGSGRCFPLQRLPFQIYFGSIASRPEAEIKGEVHRAKAHRNKTTNRRPDRLWSLDRKECYVRHGRVLLVGEPQGLLPLAHRLRGRGGFRAALRANDRRQCQEYGWAQEVATRFKGPHP